MPIGWKPRSSKLEQLIQAEEAQIEKLKNPIWTPPIANRSILPQVTAPQFTMPQLAAPTIEEPVTEQPVKREYDYDRTSLITNLPRPPNPPIDEEAELTPLQQEITRPWWERALDAFQAPFKWVDENIIRPGYGIIADPLIPDVKRNKRVGYNAIPRSDDILIYPLEGSLKGIQRSLPPRSGNLLL